MLSRLKTYKKQKQFKKILLILGALLLSICIGSGMNIALADQDVGTLLTNWFNNKQSESIKEIDSAITTEKNLLMGKLKQELQLEMQKAEDQLTQFTDAQKEQRVAALREYAGNLMANIKVDNSEEKAGISANLDFIIEKAIAEMNGAATPTQPGLEVIVKPGPTPIPDPVTEIELPATPDPLPTTSPESIPDSEQDPITNPKSTPDPELDPITNPESTPSPITEQNPDNQDDAPIDKVKANRDTNLTDEVESSVDIES